MLLWIERDWLIEDPVSGYGTLGNFNTKRRTQDISARLFVPKSFQVIH